MIAAFWAGLGSAAFLRLATASCLARQLSLLDEMENPLRQVLKEVVGNGMA